MHPRPAIRLHSALCVISIALSLPLRAAEPLPGALFIEAEDFNYSDNGVTGGLHANFGDADCSLLGKRALLNVDYVEGNVANQQPFYRAPTGVDTRPLGAIDNIRAERTNGCDYSVAPNEPGNWYNYTRVFPFNEQAFGVSLRAASQRGARVRLDRIEAATLTNQAITFLGTFEISPSDTRNVFNSYPLQVQDPAFPVIRVCGETTLRLTVVEGFVELNYLGLVSMSGELDRSRIESIYPPAGSDYARAPLIKVVIADWETAVISGSMKLWFDCRDVTAQATITDLRAGAMISFQAPDPTPIGTRCYVRVQWQDTRHCGLAPQFYEWSYLEGQYNPERNFFIEAEDFDTDRGHYFPSNPATTNGFNQKGLYQGAAAIHDVDYHFQPQGDVPLAYRAGLNPAIGMREAGDLGMGERLGFEQTTDYRVGWNTSGTWYNYTRHWPEPQRYNIYLRASHGMTSSRINSELSILHTNGTAESLGTFSGPATDGWDVFEFFPLRDYLGNLVSVRLTGQRTLRYTVLPGDGAAADLNYMMFVPRSVIVDHPPIYLRKCDLDGQVYLGFRGYLESSDSISGPWSPEPNLANPAIVPLSTIKQKFWRVIY